MRTTDGAQSKGMWNVAWSATECLKARLSGSMVQESKVESKGSLLLLCYIKLFVERLFIFLFFLCRPPKKSKHLKAQFELWNVWGILLLPDGTMCAMGDCRGNYLLTPSNSGSLLYEIPVHCIVSKLCLI